MNRIRLEALTQDARLLFMTRFVRLFAYGSLSVVLVFYLTRLGLSASQTGLLLTLTLLGDTAVSLALTTRADRFGRRRTLLIGSVLMAAAGAVFASTDSLWLLILAGTIGVISPSGNEVGPFLPVEQAALAQVTPTGRRTEVFAWYTLAGAVATATGSLVAGVLVQTSGSERAVVIEYAVLGLTLALCFRRLSPAAEVREDANAPVHGKNLLGLGASLGIVLKLSALFGIDSFGGGFVLQSFAAYWFYLRFRVNPAILGGIFFGANLLAGVSALAASRIASRIGLIRTMVFTHLPSNVLLLLVPLMPNVHLASAFLLLRFSISQMDVPARMSYTMAVVRPEERSAAAGVTGVVRTLGAAISPLLAGWLLGHPGLINSPFYFAGGLKIMYDLLLYRAFVRLRPPEEQS